MSLKEIWFSNLVAKLFSFTLMFVVNFYIAQLIYFMVRSNITFLPINLDTWYGLTTKWCIYIISFLYFGLCGIVHIEIVHKGIPLVLGVPMPGYYIPVGWSWRFPKPIMDHISIYIGEKNEKLITPELLSKGNNPITIDVKIRYIARDPFKVVRVDNLNQQIPDLIAGNLWRFAKLRSDQYLTDQASEFSIRLQKGIDRDIFSKRQDKKIAEIEELIGKEKNLFTQNESKTKEEESAYRNALNILEAHKKELQNEITELISDESLEDVPKVMRSWGIEIISILVSAIHISPEILRENISKQVEITQN
jgi:hypothetical protein